MGLIRAIANGFINFFGITQPTPQQEKQAGWFIFALLALIVAGTAVVFGVLVLGIGNGQ